jgi:hypothetical protein
MIFPACSRGRFPQPLETMQAKVWIETEADGSLVLKPKEARRTSACDQCSRRASVVSTGGLRTGKVWRDNFFRDFFNM